MKKSKTLVMTECGGFGWGSCRRANICLTLRVMGKPGANGEWNMDGRTEGRSGESWGQRTEERQESRELARDSAVPLGARRLGQLLGGQSAENTGNRTVHVSRAPAKVQAMKGTSWRERGCLGAHLGWVLSGKLPTRNSPRGKEFLFLLGSRRWGR